MVLSNNQQAFFALVRAGLWEQEVRLSQYVEIDYSAVMRLAEKQSVIGLITAGIEQVVDEKVPAEEVLQFVGASLQIEQQNQVMNRLTESLIKKLRNANINCLLVKGQGKSIADEDAQLDVIEHELKNVLGMPNFKYGIISTLYFCDSNSNSSKFKIYSDIFELLNSLY